MRKNRWAVAGAALYVAAVCCACGTQNVNTELAEQDVVQEATDSDHTVGTTPEAAGEPGASGAETAALSGDPVDTVADALAASVEFDKGRVNGQVYTNKYFGLNLTFPEEWYIASEAEVASDNSLPEEEFTNENIVKLIDNGGIPEILWAHNDDLSNPETVKISGINGVTGYVSDGADQSRFEDLMTDFPLNSGDNTIHWEVGTLRIGNNDHYWLITEDSVNGRNVVYGIFIYGEGEHKLMISVMAPDQETMEDLTHTLFF